MDWGTLVTGMLGGGVVWKVFDYWWTHREQVSERRRGAKSFADDHLDPLLKSADELVGKVCYLAKTDFVDLRDLHRAAYDRNEMLLREELHGLLYLLCHFWARIEILRQEGSYLALSEDERGRELQEFIDSLESRDVRLLERMKQRAAGETLLERVSESWQPKRYIDFVGSLEAGREGRWVSDLAGFLGKVWHTRERQRLLLYVAVVHAMLDRIDPEHHVTRNRPSYPNKLSRQTWRTLKYQVFGRYLDFVEGREKWLGSGPK